MGDRSRRKKQFTGGGKTLSTRRSEMVLEGYLKGSGATDEQKAAPGRLTAREREIVPALEALLDSPDLELVGFEAEPPGTVATATAFGGTRIVDMLVGEQLPRIC